MRQLNSSISKRLHQINEGRCDFNGLRNKKFIQNVGKEDYFKTVTLNPELLDKLGIICKSYVGLSLNSIIQFVWHHTLSIYGNGSHTVVLTITEQKQGLVVLDHGDANGNQKNLLKALENVEQQLNDPENQISLEQEELLRGKLDSLLIFDSSDENKRYEHFQRGSSSSLSNSSSLILTVSKIDNTMEFTAFYKKKLFEDETVNDLLETMLILLKDISTWNLTSQFTTSDLKFLPYCHRQQFLEWNASTNGIFPSTKRLHHLFEEAAKRTPKNVAIIYGSKKITYKELNEYSNQLAHTLLSKAINILPEQFIALFLDKNELQLLTILGIWKSGAAYVPIDPTYPDERVRFTLTDTGAKFIITNSIHKSRLQNALIHKHPDVQILTIENLLKFGQEQQHSLENLDNRHLKSTQLAYVTYTSGTTGIPKGVYKEHKGVVNSITDLSIKYEMTDPENSPESVVLFSAYVFEPFVRQSMIALLNSQKLVIVDENMKLDPYKFQEFLYKHGITYLNGTASVLQEYNLSCCPTLKKLILVGEEFTEARHQKLRQKYKGRIINEYGFTESALVTAIKIFDHDTCKQRIDRSIGKPLRNVKCYILNHSLKPVPIGVIGDLYIGGVGISRGYMNRDELTKERFLLNPFQTNEEKLHGINMTMYKTGDLARWLGNGEVEYIGRIDFQIKLRGIRIEPGEIETILMRYEGIEKCVVAVKTKKAMAVAEGKDHLIGYYVTKENARSVITEADLFKYLESKLPRYMIPARIIQLPNIPVTINGKVDLKALPDIDQLEQQHQHGESAAIPNVENMNKARHELDKILIKIWSEVLDISIEYIGIDNDFFRLGGHSITCIQVIGRIREQLKRSLDVDMIFGLRTIQKLSDHLVELKEEDEVGIAEQNLDDTSNNNTICNLDLNNSRPAVGKEIEACFLANSLQQGLMFHYLKQAKEQIAEDFDDSYVMQSVYTYKTNINPSNYKKAWGIAMENFPSLRLRFLWENNQVWQIVNKKQNLYWKFINAGINNYETNINNVNIIQQNDRAMKYSLENAQLFRIYLIQHGAQHFSLLFSCHHIILDGWSFPILFNFVHKIYLELESNHSITNTKLNLLDSSYLKTQAYLETHNKDHVDYWTNELLQVDQRSNLGGLLKEEYRYSIQLADYDRVIIHKESTLILDKNLEAKLRKVCSNNGITLHSVLQFVWHKILHVYGNGTHTVTGTTVAGRNLPIQGIENSVGFFINTLPLVVDHQIKSSSASTILKEIQSIQQKVTTMNMKSNVNLGQLQKGELKHGIFDSLFVLENYPNINQVQIHKQKEILGFKHQYDIEKLDYPLAVIARDGGNGISIALCYAGELFEEFRIQNVLQLIKQLIQQITGNIQAPVLSLNFLVPNEIEKFNDLNKMETIFLQDDGKTLNQVFEDQAATCSEKIALIFENDKLSYKEFNKKSNQFANYLQNVAKVKKNDLVGLFMDKNINLFVSIFAIWKAGAAYVPIDPSYPAERIQFILEDTNAKVLITNQQYLPQLSGIPLSNSVRLVPIESLTASSSNLLNTFNEENLQPISSNKDLAYVIYTSGTTGKPKGVMVEHRGVVNLQSSLAEIFHLRKDPNNEVILSFSNYVFDHFVEQMMDALFNGQTLLILNDEMREDKQRLYEYMIKNHVTYLSGTPSVLSMYEYSNIPSLRRIDGVGEDFTETLFNKIRSTFKGMIINGYGPTEISITSHKRIYEYNRSTTTTIERERTNKSIGFPIANTSTYVLNPNTLNRVPIGGIGELYIGGVGVARGYLNRKELTEERFIPNPYHLPEKDGTEDNTRLYKTGDLVRYLPNGELEYLGRNDFQVKVRGLRIELSEIESVLCSFHSSINAAVVIKSNFINNRATTKHGFLVGFYVGQQDLLDEQEIKNYMQIKLPAYMIPARIIRIDKIPLTVNGKVDIKLLPNVELNNNNNNDIEVLPETEIESKLARIWYELLQLPENVRLGIHDDFFSVGGDSLLAVNLSFMAMKAFAKNLSVAQIFKLKTIHTMANFIQQQSTFMGKNCSIANCSLNGLEKKYYPLSFSQERLLFIDELENGTDAFNIPITVKLPQYINIQHLEHALNKIVKRHEILRTILTTLNGHSKKCQLVLNHQHFQLEIHEVYGFEALDEGLVRESQHKFCLDKDLPFRFKIYVEKTSRTNILSLLFHHVCFDGISWFNFKHELEILHKHFASEDDNHHETQFPLLPIQYKEYAYWQRQQLQSDKQNLQKLSQYWLNKLNNIEPLNLITDYPRPAKFQYNGADFHFNISKEITANLKNLAMKLHVSLFSILTSAYGLMLTTYTNQKEVLIGTPVANRNNPELQNLIGFFVNLVVLKVNKDNSKQTLRQFLESVSSDVIESQLHQELPFEQIVRNLNIENDLNKHPIFQTVITLNSLSSSTSTQNPLANFSTLYKLEHSSYSVAKYDISATITEAHDDNRLALKGHFNYATSLFDENTVRGFAETFLHILNQFSTENEALNKQLCELSLTKSVQQKPVKEDIGNQSSFTNFSCLLEVFEENVKKCPEKIAVVCGEIELTYNELSMRANALECQLRYKLDQIRTSQSEEEQIIGLILDKSEFTIIAILAVWKAGAAYVPIDPDYPAERIQFILEDTKVKVVLTTNSYEAKVKDIATEDVFVMPIGNDILMNYNTQSPLQEHLKQDLAYVIYTSGTTGNPKGVMVEHKSLVAFRRNLLQLYFNDQEESHSKECILFLSNYIFDFSIEQIILSIFSGQKLLIVPKPVQMFTTSFYNYLNQHGLTYLSGTPTLIHHFDLAQLSTGAGSFLRMITVAGEFFTESQYNKIRNAYNGIITNAYGVTETTVYNYAYQFKANDPYLNSIGIPIGNNIKAYELNQDLQLIPEGAIGQLYLSGDCVTRGYLNQPELTQKSYISNPFYKEGMPKEYSRLYKTGDLVRSVDNNGQFQLQYLGREDEQIKIRGFRVELGEIESTLIQHPSLEQVVVILDSAKTQLIAYFITKNYQSASPNEMVKFLESKLPTSLIPTKFIQVEGNRFPLTVTGKLDIKALHELLSENQEIPQQMALTTPRNSIEAKLCEIWCEFFGEDCIGIDSDFFSLGGDSILSMQLVNQIRTEINTDKINVKDIFVCRTIRKLAENFYDKENSSGIEMRTDQGILTGNVPLLPIQKWFFARNLTSNHWNQTFTIQMNQELDLDLLKSSLVALINYHDVLRLRFTRELDGLIAQSYGGELTLTELEILIVDIREEQINNNKLKKYVKSQVNLSKGRTFAVAYLNGYDDNSSRIWFSIHHLVVDVVSWRIICRDLQRIYQNQGICDIEKGSSYRQWTTAIENYSPSADEHNYWKEIVEDVQPFNESLLMATSKSNTRISSSFKLNQEVTKSILKNPNLSRQHVNQMLLTAMAYALKESVTRSEVNFITVEGHGREDEMVDSTLDVTNTVGWFTSMYPVKLPSGHDRINSRALIEVAENLQVTPNNGIGFGPLHGYLRGRLPLVSFNYLGQFDRKINKNVSVVAPKSQIWSLVDVKPIMDSGPSANSLKTRDELENVLDLIMFCYKSQLNFHVRSYLRNDIMDNFVKSLKLNLQIISSMAAQGNEIGNLRNSIDNFEPYFEFCNNNSSSNHQPTLFILPPGEGGAESYFNNIVPKLQDHFRLIVFNNVYLHDKTLYRSIEEVANYYIKFIQKLQPQTNNNNNNGEIPAEATTATACNFLGWSFGGVVALEMCRQLSIENPKVNINNLVLIDSYFDVKKVYDAINYPEGVLDIVDPINYYYALSMENKKKNCNWNKISCKNIVLFKAARLNKMYKTNEEKPFYEYYKLSKYNNLDRLIDSERIQLFHMLDDSHLSWAKNQNQIQMITEFIKNSSQ